MNSPILVDRAPGARIFQARGASVRAHTRLRALAGALAPKRTERGHLRFVPLGGCGEVTRSCYVYEYEDDIVIVDMGLQFPDEDMPGIDYLIPNVEYLRGRRKNIRGVIITHGHYDHIGAIPHLMDALGNPPLYATALTRGVILKRQEDFTRLSRPEIHVITPESRLKLGSFGVEFFHVNHNIPDSVGVVLKTPVGTVVHTGDFKFDHSPVNERPADIARLSDLGKQGVLLLVSESTDAEMPGHQISETEVQKSLEEIFKVARGRIIAATFSSLLTRIQQLIWLSEKYNRKVVIEGHSMKQNVAVAQALGYLKVKKGTLIDSKELGDFPDERITIACTGAQGEDRAVLMRIANNEHRTIALKPNDSIIFSSSVIPGNEISVQKLKDNLYRHNVTLIHYRSSDVHSTGHGNTGELVWINKQVNAKFFMPAYGYRSMTTCHAKAVEQSGFPRENIVLADNGTVIDIEDGERMNVHKQKVPSAQMVVDGFSIGDIQEVVIRDRQSLAKDGMFVIIASVNLKTGKLRKSPDIISRGFIYLRESQNLLNEARVLIKKTIEDSTRNMNPIDLDYAKNNLTDVIAGFLFSRTNKAPMVIPVLIGM